MAEVYDGEWQLLSEDKEAGVRKWIMAIDENNFVVKTETWVPSLVAEANAQIMADNVGKRWGDGQVFARVPLHIKFGELAEPTKQQDTKWLKRYWNDPANAWMRTFPGKV